MQLSMHADYSCRVLIYLAVAGERKSSIQEIAKVYQISENHLVKVVHRLGKLGFVATSRGRGGGIRLGMDPKDINIGEVIRKSEPTFNLVECFEKDHNQCPLTPGCRLKTILYEAREVFFKKLDEYTLADLVENREAVSMLWQPAIEENATARI